MAEIPLKVGKFLRALNIHMYKASVTDVNFVPQGTVWNALTLLVPHFFLIVAKNKSIKAPYWSNPPFLIFDIRALWSSLLSARVPEYQKK